MAALTTTLFALAALFAPQTAADAPQAASAFDAQESAVLSALILPTDDENAWLAIPWRTSLWEARRQAAAAGKPILLWEMDGNPLGCT